MELIDLLSDWGLPIVFVAVFSAMLGLGIVVPLLPYYAETLGASGLAVGAILVAAVIT